MGLFITFDGPNGAGKTTIINEIHKRLKNQYSIFLTKEPTQTLFGDFLKKSRDEFTSKSYAYAIAADRCFHIDTCISKALMDYDLVFCDRYIASSLVLQRFDDVDIDFIWKLNEDFIKPDINIILIADAEKLSTRLEERENLTHYERRMRRDYEIELFKDAHWYLMQKDVKSLLFENNDNNDLEKNINSICNLIKQKMEKEND